jgi:hypothetical protein
MERGGEREEEGKGEGRREREGDGWMKNESLETKYAA